jgi:acyl-CoA hydrolase
VAVPIVKSYVESIERIQPDQANNYENAHGGEIVKLMDELAAVSAMRIAGETCVTAHIGSVDFRTPVPVGHVTEFAAYVYKTGQTSLEVQVTVDSRDPRTQGAQTTTSACFTMVAVTEAGDPVSVPDVEVKSDRGERLLKTANCARSAH